MFINNISEANSHMNQKYFQTVQQHKDKLKTKKELSKLKNKRMDKYLPGKM